MKFDFVIGNPPYQDETLGENKGFAPPVYHLFLQEAYKIADKVEMIHPARFLFNAGSTPKEWNEKMLNDPHFKVLYYEEEAKNFFNCTLIRGGVVISYRDSKKSFEPIKVFTKYSELNSILHKLISLDLKSLSSIMVSSYAYHFTQKMHEENPTAEARLSKGHAMDLKSNVLEKLPDVFLDEKPDDGKEYIQILGRVNTGRVFKFIQRQYINTVKNLDKYKVFIPSVSGSGTFGETITTPVIASPAVAATETFLGIGCFDNQYEAKSCEKYIKCKFVRTLLGVLKTTQHITPGTWKYVPLQDFTSKSDIDWKVSVAEIDQQLYRKYGLSEEEIQFIETNVKEME